jgi:hypothetical protein
MSKFKINGLLFAKEMADANIKGRKTETSRANLRGIKPGDWFYQRSHNIVMLSFFRGELELVP